MHSALRAYAATARTGLAGRALEAAVLTRCANDMQRASAALPDAWPDLLDALERNRKAWKLFASEARDPETELPADIRRNLLVTAAFVFGRTAEICDLKEGAPVQALVEPLAACNRQLAAGLEGRPA